VTFQWEKEKEKIPRASSLRIAKRHEEPGERGGQLLSLGEEEK